MLPSVDTSVCFPLPSSGFPVIPEFPTFTGTVWGRKTPLHPSRQSLVSLDRSVPPLDARFAPWSGASNPNQGLVRCGRVDLTCDFEGDEEVSQVPGESL